MQQKAVIMDESAVNRAIMRITYEIIERNKGAEDICVIGILSRGIHIARRIADKISELEQTDIKVGTIDITAYRDDSKQNGENDRTDIPFSITDMRVILVDDVVFTGRSTRAAIEAVMRRGRPRCIQLAVLLDRGHRELPIRPDYVGKNVPTSSSEQIKVFVRELDGCDKAIICDKEESSE